MGRVQTLLDGESLVTPETIAAMLDLRSREIRGDRLSEAQAALALVLGVAQERLRGGHAVERAVHGLFGDLNRLRRDLDPATWLALVPMAQNHPVAALIHQDPFTAWSFEKPRGYSGDARLLDFIYGHDSTAGDVAAASDLGRAIFGYTRAAPAAAAVRERRDILARLVDETAAAREGRVDVLTVASGHLREAERCQALGAGRIGRWVALDQDPWSIGTVARDFAGTPVEAVNGSVRGLLAGTYALGRFDLVYAAGLYDYLPRAVAIRLTRACLDMLKPGGVFLFANFERDIADDGYMETFMNWSLLLRSQAEMRDIVEASVPDGSYESEIFHGANRNILYATLRRPG